MYRFVVSVALLPMFLLSGCGGSKSDGPVGSVTGRLTMDGEPLRPGTGIMFMNLEHGTTALGATDEDGNYSLRSFSKSGDSDLFRTGMFAVSIQAPADDYIAEEDVTADQALEGVTPGLQVPLQFPKRYQSTDTSELSYKVVEGENAIDIDIASK